MNDELLVIFVRRRLREEGSKNWPAIAAACGKPLSVLRKLAYGDKANPRIDTIEPLAIHLRRLLLPAEDAPKTPEREATSERRKVTPRSS
jgi:hypothetical protein